MLVLRLRADPRLGTVRTAAAGSPQLRAQIELPTGEYTFDDPDAGSQENAHLDRHRAERFEFRVPLAFVQSAAARMEYRRSLVWDLFLYIPFFLMYLFLVVLEGSVEQTYFISWSLGSRLYSQDIPPISAELGPSFGRTFEEITDVEDFYLWANGTLLDLHYQEPQRPNYVGGPNVQFGAVRFRVQRVRDNSCDLDGRWIPDDERVFPQLCYASHSDGALNRSAFGPENASSIYPFVSGCYKGYVVGDMSRYDCSGNIFDLSFALSKEQALEAILQLNPTESFPGFFNPIEARFVSVSFATYNQAVDHFSLTTIWFEHSPTGTFIPGWRTVHFPVFSDRWVGWGVFSIIFFVAVVVHLCTYIKGLVTAFRRRKLLDKVLQVWSLLDIANIVSLVVFFGFRFAWWDKSQKSNIRLTTEGVFDTELEAISILYDAQTFSATVSTLLIFLRLLKFSMLSSRLGVINRTLDSASQHLVNLLVIFLMVVLSYAVMATALFGSGMRDFYSYDNAIASLLRMLIGDFDYDGLKEEQWYLAALFFWSFIILGLFLLLNMMIAVIGDAFEQEQKAAAGVPIAEEIAEFFRSAWRTVVRVMTHPSSAVSTAVKFSRKGLANQGKHGILEEQMRAYRMSLPREHVTQEQFLLLTEEERELVMPNPKINRYDVTSIFSIDEESIVKYEWLHPAFVDDFWLDVVAEYRFFRDEKEMQRVNRRKAGIKVASAEVLCQILDDDAVELPGRSSTELFGVTCEALEVLHAIGSTIESIEEKAKDLGDVVSRVDAVKMNAEESSVEAATAVHSHDDTRAVSSYRKYIRTTTAVIPS
jgi:hypothetical protein